MIIWLATIICNLILALLLVYRGHHGRYRILLFALIFEVFAAPVLYFDYTTYGTNSHSYYLLFHIKKMITILFNFGIVFEGWSWRNKCLRIPEEIYLFTLFVAFVAEKSQFLLVSNAIHDGLRYSNIVLTLWWIWCFSAEHPNERRNFRYN